MAKPHQTSGLQAFPRDQMFLRITKWPTEHDFAAENQSIEAKAHWNEPTGVTLETEIAECCHSSPRLPDFLPEVPATQGETEENSRSYMF